MADPTTWVDVADNAVKIGLGALLGGGFGLLLASLNNKSQVKKALYERRREILESIVDAVDSTCNAAAVHWATLANAVFKRDTNQRIADADMSELTELERKFFASYTTLNGSAAKLMLLEEAACESKVVALRAALDEFFGIAHVENEKCTKEALESHKSAISAARRDLYSEIGKAYKRAV
jgi:hypothetical protein